MATQTVIDRITQAQNLLIARAEEFPSGIIPVEQMDSVILEIGEKIGISRENVESVGMEAGKLPSRGEIEIFRFKQSQSNQPQGESMAKINLWKKLKPNVVKRIRVCIPFMQTDFTYDPGKAKEALEALKGVGLECSHATLNNDSSRLRAIGVTNVSQIDLEALEQVFEAPAQRKRAKQKETKTQESKIVHSDSTSQLTEMIEKLEAEIAEKQKDLQVLKAAQEVIARRGM